MELAVIASVLVALAAVGFGATMFGSRRQRMKDDNTIDLDSKRSLSTRPKWRPEAQKKPQPRKDSYTKDGNVIILKIGKKR